LKETLRHKNAFELYFKTRSIREVAKEMGVSKNSVDNWNREFNWQERVEKRERLIADKVEEENPKQANKFEFMKSAFYVGQVLDTFLIFDVLIFGCGIYLIYAALKMKKTGEIDSTAIVGKNCNLNKAKDKQGFIDYMYKKSIIMGILIMIGGAIDFVNEKYLQISYLGVVTSVVFFVFIVIYCKISMDAQKKFLS